MAKNTRIAVAIANAQADLLARELDDGYLRIYSGTQPAGADTAITDQVLLAELRLADPCAPAASNGVLTFTVVAPVFAAAADDAAWFRALKSDGTTAVLDGNVGLAGDAPNLIVSNTEIAEGDLFVVASLSHTVLLASAGL